MMQADRYRNDVLPAVSGDPYCYSCLLSVYRKEKAEYLIASFESMLNQYVPPSEFVLIVDGPVGDELETAIKELDRIIEVPFQIIRLSQNMALHYSLRIGVESCSHEIIARMDTDDISSPSRMQKQLRYLSDHKECDAVGCLVDEFIGYPENVVAHVLLPEDQDEIVAYSKKRNPCRHPALTFRRRAVLDAGNYQDMPFFEDYDLIVRMLSNGSIFHNIQEVLYYMRIGDDFYARRGGVEYLRCMHSFRITMKKRGLITALDLVVLDLIHGVVCLLPNVARHLIYTKLLRK
jgi:glycosyltransferase involved in cell wall biosynthesis